MTDLRVNLTQGAVLPARRTPGSVGYDLVAVEDVFIHHGERKRVRTGVAVALPDGWEAQVRPRSSLSLRGIDAPLGTVDTDYRGEIGVVLANLMPDRKGFQVKVGDRIAQLVFARVETPTLVEVQSHELGETERGAGGFGSTGVR